MYTHCEVVNLGQNNIRNSRNETLKTDDPVGNFRVSIDESILLALLECSYADSKHEVLGYLGGTCDVDRLDNTIVCHVSQFVASERVVTSLLTDTVQEVDQAREDAINTFKKMGLKFIGWYRSNLDSNSNTIPTQYDIIKQQSIQSQYPDSAGVIVSMSTISCPPINIRGLVSERSINALCVFRTVETNPNNNDSFSLSQAVKSKNSRILKGKEKEDSKANKVIFTVNRQMYMCSNVMQQLNHALMTVLREIKQTYSGQVLDCDNRIGQRIFVDSQHESFLMNFLKKSVLQFDRSIDQDFRSLAVAKHHVKTLIMKRVNDALATCQGHNVNNGNDVHLRRRKLEKLIEKLVTQRMAKREKGCKKSENVDDVVRWMNHKSLDNDRQNTSDGFEYNDVNMEIPAIPTFPSSEHSSQKPVTYKKESESIDFISSTSKSILPMDTRLDDMIEEKMITTNESKDGPTDVDCDTKIIRDTDALIEICENLPVVIPAKQPLKKTSTDSSRNAPNAKRVKSFGGNLAQAASFPESKPFIGSGSGSTSMMGGSSFNSNQKNTSSMQFSLQYSPINTYQYSTNCYRPFHNTPEDLSPSIRPSVPCIGNKPTNGPPGTGVNLPPIQGLLEITRPPPPSQSSLSNGVVVVNQNTPGVVHPPFSTQYQNNFYSFGSPQLSQQTNHTQTGSHSIVAPMPQHLHQMNSPTPQSSSQRHYIPIAPSPTTTTGNRPPLPSSSPSATIYTTSSHHSYTTNYHDEGHKLAPSPAGIEFES
ncbi:14762_t:CDS:10 [Dentiscutata erythropus]|uniref:14762_t:CDS:1 n=1 Tax=Dentiscutata erythropus TaxID=1348616 RepID=A0A9N9FM72_9GLOM|nr:14762_t:CDS:10 [Dentiscutata erythropus]